MIDIKKDTIAKHIRILANLGCKFKRSFCYKSFFSIECFNFNLWISKCFKFQILLEIINRFRK